MSVLMNNSAESIPIKNDDQQQKPYLPTNKSYVRMLGEPHHQRMTGHLVSQVDPFTVKENNVEGGQFIARNSHVVFKPA